MARDWETTRARMPRLVAAFRRSGKTRAEFARSAGITVFKLDYWSRRVTNGEPAASEGPAGFVPVRVRVDDGLASSAVEIELSGGERIRLGAGVSGDRLREIVRALRG